MTVHLGFPAHHTESADSGSRRFSTNGSSPDKVDSTSRLPCTPNSSQLNLAPRFSTNRNSTDKFDSTLRLPCEQHSVSWFWLKDFQPIGDHQINLTVSFMGIFVSNFRYSVFAVCSLAVSICLSPRWESHQILDEYYSPPSPPPSPPTPHPPLPDYQHQWFPDEILTSRCEPAPSGPGSQQFLYRNKNVKCILITRIIILGREFLINTLIFLHVWIWSSFRDCVMRFSMRCAC
jgi:hypothetical protein